VEGYALTLLVLALTAMTEEFEQQADLFFFGGFEDLGYVMGGVPIPRINYSSEMRLVSS